MGRTKRKRSRRSPVESVENGDQSIIDLQKWMARNGWKNDTKLKLRSFLNTGRGLSSKQSIRSNDVLINIPFELMITYSSFKKHLADILYPGSKLSMHELLSLFLVYETNKKDVSPWRYYIDSLPLEIPHLPWHNNTNELHDIGRTNHEKFMRSLDKVRTSIKHEVLDYIAFNENTFRWAYVMVNTRAVYVDPNHVGDGEHLQDEPCLALCPFLDMFNHHFLANTEAALICNNGKLVYQLKTLSPFKKDSQIFISYGNHSNTKLVMEYGFFIPGNIYDIIEFTFTELLMVLDMDLGQAKYRYICNHLFNNDLYLYLEGLSYNLKAVLFIWLSADEDEKYFNSIIFSDSYPLQFSNCLPNFVKILLNYKKNMFKKEYDMLHSRFKISNEELVGQFLLNRINFLSDIDNKLRG